MASTLDNKSTGTLNFAAVPFSDVCIFQSTIFLRSSVLF